MVRIDNWPLDRIMRLPDWCFGRRWWVGTYCGSTQGTVFYGISEEELPDKFVVWGVFISNRSPNCLEALRLSIRLGDHIPANVADVSGMERLFKGISAPNIVYEFYPESNAMTWVNIQRQLIESSGRRITFVANGDQAIAYEMTVGIQISAMPKELPEWLVSGPDKNQL